MIEKKKNIYQVWLNGKVVYESIYKNRCEEYLLKKRK